MIDTQELTARILSELEEAGQENLPTIANTVFEPTGNSDELAQLQVALEQLVLTDFARLAVERDMSRRLKELSKEGSLTLVADLGNHLTFKDTAGHWTGGVRPWPEVVVTPAGKEKAFQILDQRGYQWWRAGSK